MFYEIQNLSRQFLTNSVILRKSNKHNMGKGDKKSRRGKISNNSYGARRPRKIKKRPTVEEKIDIKKKK